MIFLYTDASFRNTDGVGVLGFLIFENESAHDASEFILADVHCETIEEINNIRCEFRAMLAAMNYVAAKSSLASQPTTLFTDCQAISKLPSRRESLEKNHYQSRRSHKELNNADLYQEFFRVFDALKPVICWTKGHTSQSSQNAIQKNFSLVDKAVRENLRAIPVGEPRKSPLLP